MKRLKSSYFGQTFTLFFTSSLLLLAILTILVSYFFFQTYSEKITEECESTVENVGMTLQNVMAEYQEALQTLEDSSNVQRFLSGETDTSMQKTIARQLYSIKNQMSTRAELSIVELEKGVWSSTSTYNESIRIENCMNWGVFREAQDADDVIVYAVPKDLVLEDDVRIAFAKACRDDEGELQGFLLVELSRTLISDIVTECAGSYNTAVMMVNANGSIVYHSSGTDYEGRNKLEAYGEEDELKTASGKKTVWGNYACYYSETLDLY
ncbi:MAG: cache domain-containing protein, partial [Lachnospiraceae bacterium]|nr:cache domain-containing protein [Lachnospiraceae bacterium]